MPDLEQDSYAIDSERQAQLVDRYIPKVKDGGYKKCHILPTIPNVNDTRSSTAGFNNGTSGNVTECSEWVYDKTVMKENLVSKVSGNHRSVTGHSLLVFINWYRQSFIMKIITPGCFFIALIRESSLIP